MFRQETNVIISQTTALEIDTTLLSSDRISVPLVVVSAADAALADRVEPDNLPKLTVLRIRMRKRFSHSLADQAVIKYGANAQVVAQWK